MPDKQQREQWRKYRELRQLQRLGIVTVDGAYISRSGVKHCFSNDVEKEIAERMAHTDLPAIDFKEFTPVKDGYSIYIDGLPVPTNPEYLGEYILHLKNRKRPEPDVSIRELIEQLKATISHLSDPEPATVPEESDQQIDGQEFWSLVNEFKNTLQ